MRHFYRHAYPERGAGKMEPPLRSKPNTNSFLGNAHSRFGHTVRGCSIVGPLSHAYRGHSSHLISIPNFLSFFRRLFRHATTPNKPEVAWARYGSVPTRSGYHHEMSLRILLHAINTAAGRHRRSIQPVLSVAIDHVRPRLRARVALSQGRPGRGAGENFIRFAVRVLP